jgi:bis(5'-nucleosyl)-tetraphosphatase (symmetrical)
VALYAIGDIQGCAESFTRLLDAISFKPGDDHLWLVGDLVNRGADSLGVLRDVMNLGDSATAVLGNHDLHLLATAAGVRKPSAADTFQAVLAAPDAGDILDWLRELPLVHHDPVNNRLLVHAGIPPAWTALDAVAYASDVSEQLRGPRWTSMLKTMYGDEPRVFPPSGPESAKLRYSINALTRMRFCTLQGDLDFDHNGAPGTQPDYLIPWFEVSGRASVDTHIVFGHWASLGLLQLKNLTALDTGCVWGRSLTAIPLDPADPPIAVSCSGS